MGQCPAKVPSLFRIDLGRGHLLDEEDVRGHLFAYQGIDPHGIKIVSIRTGFSQIGQDQMFILEDDETLR